MEKHQGFNQDNISQHYDDLCTNYDAIYEKVGFPCPKNCAQMVHALKDADMKEDQVQILDLGCGTGFVGQYLAELGGYTQIDGIDASKGMLEEAKKKGVYRDLIELFLCNPTQYPARFHGQYDFVTASGVFADNHFDTSVFEEILMSLKPGGIAIFTTRIEYLTKYGYGPFMDNLVKENKWKLVKQDTYSKYDKAET